MNICILSRSTVFHKSYGGMELVADDLAQQFSLQGHNVVVITTSLDQYQEKRIQFIENGYTVVSIPRTKPSIYSRAWWKEVIPQFEKLNEEIEFDIIFSVSAAANSLVKNKRKYGIPFVFQAHGTSIGEIKTKLALGWRKKLSSVKNIYGYLKDIYYIPKYDLLIAAGEKTYKEYQSTKLQFNKRITLINNAVDTKKFRLEQNNRLEIRNKLKIPLDANVFISTSRLHPEKGIIQSLKIFKEVKEEIHNSYFLIIGNGPERKNIEDQVKTLGLKDSVILLGTIKRELLSKYYSCSDFLLFATLREEVGLPLTVLEAMSNSVIPFISESTNLVSDFKITSIKPFDVVFSARKIINYIKKNSRECDNQLYRDFITSNYSLEKWANKYLNEFEDLIKGVKI